MGAWARSNGDKYWRRELKYCVRFKHTEINVVTKKSIRKLTFYKYSVIICLSADYIMMVKNLSMDQFFWINSHVNSLLDLTFTLTRLFWHLLTLTCSICAMRAEWSEQLWTSQTLLPLHAVAWFLSIVWPPSESQLVAFCSWWRKWNTCTCILQRFNVILSIYSLEILSDQCIP